MDPGGAPPRITDFMGNIIPPGRLANLTSWAVWDSDGRTPSWVQLRDGGQLAGWLVEPATAPLTAAEIATLTRDDRRRRVLAELAADRRPVTRGLLRLMLARHRRRLVAEVAEALSALTGGRS